MSAFRPAVRTSAINVLGRVPRATAPGLRFQSTSTGTSASQSTATSLPLSWPDYLALRHRRRMLATIFSIPGAVGGLVGGGAYFGSLEADPTQPIFGIEPMFVYAGATLGCMGLGYLAGPTIGTLFFKAVNGSRNKAMDVMDKRFYEHIKARRVDPSYQSVNNPTPDYYGEKIKSIPTYRRWLRDQAAYRRKALHGMKEEEAL
ncbi:TIM23 complex component [Naganishia albida]|nr:TIM23 complex component [Naganishia albida]